LSHSKGRLTFGDSGTLNYAWCVNDVPYTAVWDRALPHSPKRIVDNPPVLKLDFAEPSAWPTWYDPSYWFEGLHPSFHLRQQIQAFSAFLGVRPDYCAGTSTLREMMPKFFPLYAGLAVFALIITGPKKWKFGWPGMWLFLWPLLSFLLMASVHLEQRYVIPFIVLGWVGIYVSCCLLVKAEAFTPVILLVAVLFLALNARDLGGVRHTATGSTAIELSHELERLGIQRGDNLVTVGAPGIPPAYYPVSLIGARYGYLVAEDPDMAFDLPEDRVRTIIEALRSDGAKAIISLGRPAFKSDSGWIPAHGIYVRPLR
jgi:hypothetical protein